MALDSFCGRLLSRAVAVTIRVPSVRQPHGSLLLLLLPLLSKRKKEREGESVNVGETKRSRVRERRVRVRSIARRDACHLRYRRLSEQRRLIVIFW